MEKTKLVGPLQLMVVAFDNTDFTGKVADEIKKLSDKDFIRVVDAIVVAKYGDGNVVAVQASDLSLEEAREYGAYIGALIGIGSGDESIAEELAAEAGGQFQERYQYGLSQEDIDAIADSIPTDGAALMMLVEHKWAAPLRNAFRDAGGLLVAQDFLSPELLVSLGSAIYEEAYNKDPQQFSHSK